MVQTLTTKVEESVRVVYVTRCMWYRHSHPHLKSLYGLPTVRTFAATHEEPVSVSIIWILAATLEESVRIFADTRIFMETVFNLYGTDTPNHTWGASMRCRLYRHRKAHEEPNAISTVQTLATTLEEHLCINECTDSQNHTWGACTRCRRYRHRQLHLRPLYALSTVQKLVITLLEPVRVLDVTYTRNHTWCAWLHSRRYRHAQLHFRTLSALPTVQTIATTFEKPVHFLQHR